MFTRVRSMEDRLLATASPKLQVLKVERAGRAWVFELPQRYFDWTMMMAHFPASAARVRKLLPSRELQPVQIVPGIALVTLAAFEYHRAATLAPYNEVAMMVPVRCQAKSNPPFLPLVFPHWFKDLGFYVFRLPVTTQEACDIGIEIWGFPKFVADIEFESEGEVRRCHLRYEGKHVLTLEQKIPVFAVEQPMDFLAYPVKERELLKTLVQTKARYTERRLPFGASCTLGDHPIAEELRGLSMCRHAFGRLYGVKAESLLNGPSERIPV